MAFLAGTVSFSRFKVVGGSPKRLDESLLEKLRNQAIGKQRVMRADNEEVGWIGGRHVLDQEFDLEKNVLLDCLHFGLRVDASRVPPDLMRAYVEMELDALRDGNGDGNARAFARLKKQAVEAARKRADREVKDGRYRRLRQFPILLDTRNDVLYVGATQPAVLERLHPLFKETFGRRLEPITAGRLGYDRAEQQGISRKLENLRPSTFVAHPDGDGHIDVYWTAHDSTSRDYLGNEFLLWLWYTLSEETDTIELPDKTEASVVIVKQLALECPWAQSGKEVITCEGPTQLPESRRAIQSGKLPRKAGLILARQDEQYEFTLQAETFNISSAALPRIEGNGNPRARIEERVEQIRHLAETVDLLFFAFLQDRLGSDWQARLDKLKTWLRRG
ncbi:MAG: hypothetical protein JXQ75_13530 [Phycisphaerae bacterium]|nr:hypothetical protein [Phycisphaerae bacterium]